MGELKNWMIGILIIGAVVTGFASILTDWYGHAAPSNSINNPEFSAIGNSSRYITDWANQTAFTLQNSPLNNVPLVGPGFLFLQSIYSVLLLLLNLPAQVVGPLITSLAIIFSLPWWFVAFVVSCMVVIIVIAVVNAAKGGSV